MKRLKNLTVSCTYTVGLTDVEVQMRCTKGWQAAMISRQTC